MTGDRRAVVGRVVGTHGIRGEIRIRVLGDGPENLMGLPRVALGTGDADEAARDFEVEASGRGRPGEVRLRLRGVADRGAAEALRGLWVLAEREHLRPLAEGEHYWFELIGCRVETTAGEPIGSVGEIWETGAHDVLVVEAGDGTRRLVPAAQELLKEVDIEGRRIVVEPIPGLLDPTAR